MASETEFLLRPSQKPIMRPHACGFLDLALEPRRMSARMSLLLWTVQPLDGAVFPLSPSCGWCCLPSSSMGLVLLRPSLFGWCFLRPQENQIECNHLPQFNEFVPPPKKRRGKAAPQGRGGGGGGEGDSNTSPKGGRRSSLWVVLPSLPHGGWC